MTSEGSGATPTGPAPAGRGPRKRGRETAGDMLRSLGLVMILVVVMWFLAQPPDSDEQSLRVVDPTQDVTAFSAAVPGVPVPTGLPEQWRATSSTLTAGQLRIGYVTPDDEYAEYAATTAPAEEALPDLTGTAQATRDRVEVEGQPWRVHRDDEALSLVRTYGRTLVVVGSLRSTASQAELETLAAHLRP